MPKQSPLIAPNVNDTEREERSGWIIRTLSGSLTGRIVNSVTGTTKSAAQVACLSPWGDQSPLLLPNVRFRDFAFTSLSVATGGTASILGPLTDPAIADGVMSMGSSMTAEVLGAAANKGVGQLGDWALEEVVDKYSPQWDRITTTQSIKTIRITFKYKLTMRDASIGFFRASAQVHTNTDIFTSVKDFLSVQKGWFSPYLFSTCRRPVIPRKISPDVVYAHGPFLQGDYDIATRLLAESIHRIDLCIPTPPPMGNDATPRRLVLLLLGIKPYKLNMWTTSQRPGESIMNYLLFDGCPAIILPARPGTPLIAWDSITLKELYRLKGDTTKEKGVVDCWYEFLNLCVELERVRSERDKDVLRDAIEICVHAALKSADCKAVDKEVDASRAGLVVMRMP